jgi:hypothetical protein
MRRTLAPLLPLVLIACGGGGGGPEMGTRETWVAAQVLLPTNATDAGTYGFDVDGDTTVDNQLGAVLSALLSASGGLDLQGQADEAVSTGAAVQLVETTTGASAAVAFQTGTPGTAPCTDPSDVLTCGQHLHGSTSFTASAPANPALAGTGTSAAFQAGPGAATLQVPLFGAQAVTLPLVMARASFTRSGATLSGKVGGAVPMAAVDSVVVPALHDWIAAAVALDCSGGACTPGSTGEALLSLFDTDGDGVVTLPELQGNPLISALLAPDVDTNGDHVLDALSVGFGYQLVGAVF